MNTRTLTWALGSACLGLALWASSWSLLSA